MRDRLETVLLFFTLLAVAGFVGSFVAGLDWTAPSSNRGASSGVSARPPAAANPAPADQAAMRRRVEVLNGAGTAGIARDATQLLRDRGYDVVFFGNAGRFDHTESVVVDRVGDMASARSIADALGIAEVRSEPDPSLYLDVSVVLGSDWTPPPAAEREPAPAGIAERFRRLWREVAPKAVEVSP